MNKIYRLIWNHAAGQWVVSSELTKSRGKRSKLVAAAVAMALALPAAAMADDTCRTEADAAGTLDAEGICVADIVASGGIGLMGALDGGTATGVGAVSIGPSSRAAGENATAVGSSANAGSSGSVAIGHNANTTTGGNATAIGYYAKAGSASLAGGTRAEATTNSVALGGYSTAAGDRSVAVGNQAKSSSANASAFGSGAQANAASATAIGSSAVVAAQDGVAIGRSASVVATGIGAVALGNGAIANRASTISVGAAGSERQVVNVAAGTEDTDAVNVAQLKAIGVIDDNGNTLAAVVYDNDQRDSITLGGASATQPVAIGNVADGKIEASSTDAVNGSQLHTASIVLGQQIGQVSTDLVDATRYFKASGANNGTDDAIAAGTGSLALGASANASNRDGIAIGRGAATSTGDGAIAIGSNASATGENSIALGAGSAADRDNVLSVGWGAGGNGTRQIINVANGNEGFDAVNVNQLTPVVSALGGGTNINAMTGVVTGPTYNIQGADYNNVGDALGSVDSSLTLIDGRVTDIWNNLETGAIGLVQQDAISRDITIGTGTDGGRIVLAGTAGDRVVSGIASGIDDNDAVNLAQLKATGLVGQNGDSLSAVVYDAADKAVVSFAGANGTVLNNVADGELDDNSRQAVNGSQLHATNTQVEQNSTDISNVDNRVTNLDGRVTTIDGRVTNIDNRVSNIEAGFNDGSIGLVRQDATSRDISVAAGTDGGRIVLAGSAGDRVVSGVAAGSADNDAVNIGQLKAAGLVGADGSAVNMVAYDSAAKDSVTLGGSTASQAVKLKNVADATEDDEAVNLAQLKAAGLVGDAGQTLDAVTYDADSNRGQITFAGANGTVLANVGDGRIQSGSRDAVNGGQIAALRDQLQGQIGDIDNRVTNIENNGGGGSADNPYFDANGDEAPLQSGIAPLPAADAQASGASAVAAGNGASASGNASVAVGANSEAKADNSVALGAGSVADRDNTVAVGRQGGERQITHVAAGVRDTDAVNVSQLNQRLAEAKDYTDQRMDDMWNGVNDRIDHANRQANRGIAGASALVQVTPYLPGKTVLNAGMATYRGESAMGVGISRWSDNGRVNVNAGVSMARGDSAIFRVGVGVVLGD